MKRICWIARFFSLLLMGVVLIGFTGGAWAAAVGKVSTAIGTIQILRGGKLTRAAKGDDLFEGDTVTSGDKSASKLSFIDGSSHTLFQKTRFKIDKYEFKETASGGNQDSKVEVLEGKVKFFVKPSKKGTVNAQIKMANSVMALRGTEGTAQVQGAKATIRMYKGFGVVKTMYRDKDNIERTIHFLIQTQQEGLTDGVSLPIVQPISQEGYEEALKEYGIDPTQDADAPSSEPGGEADDTYVTDVDGNKVTLDISQEGDENTDLENKLISAIQNKNNTTQNNDNNNITDTIKNLVTKLNTPFDVTFSIK